MFWHGAVQRYRLTCVNRLVGKGSVVCGECGRWGCEGLLRRGCDVGRVVTEQAIVKV